MTVEWRFTADDVARLRFAFSPLWELVMSLRVLRAPSRHSLHLPWLRAVRPRLGDLDLRELFVGQAAAELDQQQQAYCLAAVGAALRQEA